MPSNYYRRFADPRATFVMVSISVEDDQGRRARPFDLRLTQDEFEALMERSQMQAKHREWPPPPQGRRYEPANSYYARSGPDFPFSDPTDYGRPFFTDTGFFGGPNTPPNWSAAQEKAEQDEANRKTREAREKAKAQEEARKAREKFEEAFSAANTMTDTQARHRLADLAGVEWPYTLPDTQVYKRALRKTHPDTGGSHELFIEVMKIAEHLGLVSQTRAGRSAG